ncbi:hypothetical protein CPB84DRAFT_1774965 [Gymnopilus junonius]|uniref:Secreted protein n=1 Tax=Gymnopilus junonius TaxID=109634 RepID=A0A9P5NQM9_GYMJU|nr:hypothetical protein CPB84DRAFT_1774965 [Gymnopilus junonius]
MMLLHFQVTSLSLRQLLKTVYAFTVHVQRRRAVHAAGPMRSLTVSSDRRPLQPPHIRLMYIPVLQRSRYFLLFSMLRPPREPLLAIPDDPRCSTKPSDLRTTCPQGCGESF